MLFAYIDDARSDTNQIRMTPNLNFQVVPNFAYPCLFLKMHLHTFFTKGFLQNVTFHGFAFRFEIGAKDIMYKYGFFYVTSSNCHNRYIRCCVVYPECRCLFQNKSTVRAGVLFVYINRNHRDEK